MYIVMIIKCSVGRSILREGGWFMKEEYNL